MIINKHSEDWVKRLWPLNWQLTNGQEKYSMACELVLLKVTGCMMEYNARIHINTIVDTKSLVDLLIWDKIVQIFILFAKISFNDIRIVNEIETHKTLFRIVQCLKNPIVWYSSYLTLIWHDILTRLRNYLNSLISY